MKKDAKSLKISRNDDAKRTRISTMNNPPHTLEKLNTINTLKFKNLKTTLAK